MNLQEYMNNVVHDVDLMIRRHFVDATDELNKASAHLLLAGGKRLRPSLLLLSADAVKKGSSYDLMPAALAVELTHTFTLIHDDIMDRDAERRGVPTVHTLWDEPTAILAGDVLYARAFEFLSVTPATEGAKLRAVSLLAHTCAKICEGQHMDMSFEKRTDVTEGEYLEMVQKKTGTLFAASAAMGAILAGAKPTQVDAVHQFGLLCGIAFQIQDDLIDIISRSERTGKDRASDIRKEKQTLIAIKAREKGIDLSSYRHVLSDREVDEVAGRLRSAGIIEEVQEVARGMLEQGSKTLKILPESEERALLLSLGRFFISRRY
ncbi:MAG: polyprenyl synthetase family protein [Methanomicrobiales archaeon]|nr:polyprenyl synthetase family protein [Methanomicrobiales archaeon]